jgi:outer membrane protein assembly factor BamA
VEISGNTQFATSQLRSEMVTTTRSWYTPWRSRPRFDPVTFKTDIERLQGFYRTQGYYEAQIMYDLQLKGELVTAQITITEGKPVLVSQITLQVADESALAPTLEALRPELPLTEGRVFTEEHYQEAESKIKERFRDLHYGRVKVTRQATVIIEQHTVEVHYTVEAGPATVFGETVIVGTRLVNPRLVSRELTYQAGKPFSSTAIDESRKNLLKLDLFSAVRFIEEDSPSDPSVIPMQVKVSEKPFREWQAGIGYGTEDQVRAQVRWRHNNWLGDGRKLDVQVRVSSIVREIKLSFLQPHVFGRDNRFLLTFGPQQLDEPGYLLNATRLQPRFERDFTRQFTGFIAYRLEYDQLNNVAESTAQALADFQRRDTLRPLHGLYVEYHRRSSTRLVAGASCFRLNKWVVPGR